MSDTEEGTGSSTPPSFRRLSVKELQQFCIGPNSRDRALSLLQQTTAGELLQQTAAAADAVALQQQANTAETKETARKAALRAAAAGDTEAAANVGELLQLLLQSVKRAFEIEDLRDSILSQPEICAADCAARFVLEGAFAKELERLATKASEVTLHKILSPLNCLLLTVSSCLSPLVCLLASVSSLLSPLVCLLLTVSSSLSPLDCLLSSVSS
ncbi:hypothetical protein, conserved [Eimeria praecox]|uniref:Uncharacterized protein n=1 Tax=Eimeria praecox TaxID=51316 RepID=U6HB15_9EIME|nr:hypothetical protein, conserved [Eimeria praecox]